MEAKLKRTHVFSMVGIAMGAATATATPPARTALLNDEVTLPIGIASTPSDPQHIYVCERAGRVQVLNRDTGVKTPSAFLDIASEVSLESDNGLLGMAFDPAYASNGFVFINYNDLAGNIVLARYHCEPGSFEVDASSATTIWRYPRPLGHNGGWIGFSPINGYLYITSGDGDLGGTPDFANRAQTIVDQRMGKIFRIDPFTDEFPDDPDRNYRVPPDNPFVGVVGDDEIWAYGVRNPWRASFDRLTGNFYFGDVGMDSWEEVNVELASSPGGRNYGWPCMEGTHCTISDRCTCNDPSLTLPVYDYAHAAVSASSVTGGYVYRGSAIPGLQGQYIFADFLRFKIRSFRPMGDAGFTDLQDLSIEFTPAGTSIPLRFVASFGEDADGELYICDIVDGRVYKVVPYPCEPVVDLGPTSQSEPLGATITLSVLGAGADPLTFRWQKDGVELSDDQRIQGAATQVLTIDDAHPSDSGLYDVVLTSPCGTARSAVASIQVFLCRSADINQDSDLTVQDIFDFLALYFSNAPGGDFNDDSTISVQDIFDFLQAFFSVCV